MIQHTNGLRQWFSTFFGSRHTIVHHKFLKHTRTLDNHNNFGNFAENTVSIFNKISRHTPVENHWINV